MSAFLVIAAIIGILLGLYGLAIVSVHLSSYIVIEIKVFNETVINNIEIRREHLREMKKLRADFYSKKRDLYKTVKQLKAENKKKILLEKIEYKNKAKDSKKEQKTDSKHNTEKVKVQETKKIEPITEEIKITTSRITEPLVSKQATIDSNPGEELETSTEQVESIINIDENIKSDEEKE